MDTCIVTVIEDQDISVKDLEMELKRHYDVVQFLALGSSSFIDYHQTKYSSSVSLFDLSTGINADRIFVTSIQALLELGKSLKHFKNVTFWFDPTCLFGTHYIQQSKTNQSASIDLICSTICDALTISTGSALVAKTKEGKIAWRNTYNADVPIVSEYFTTTFSGPTEPLIEKQNQQRFMVDAGNSYTTIPLVDPFLILQENFKDIEIWCHFNGELPLWMRPDFQIKEISSLEMPLYTNSIDGLVITGKALDQRKTIEYMTLGLLPIIIDEHLGEELNKIIDTNSIKKSFPSFGSVNILHELAESPEKLELYNSYSTTKLRSNVIFEGYTLKGHSVNTDACTSFLQSFNFRKSREFYLESSYGSPEGTEAHKVLEGTSTYLDSITGKTAKLISLKGWCVDTHKLTEAQPCAYLENNQIPCIIRRKDRADVAEAFGLNNSVPVGFESLIFVADSTPKTQVKLAILAEDSKLAKVGAFGGNLQPFVNLEGLEEHKLLAEDTDQYQGVLEHYESTESIEFDLSDIQPCSEELILKLKCTDNLFLFTNIDFYLTIDDTVLKLESDCIDEGGHALTVHVNKDSFRCILHIHNFDSDELGAGKITCHAYSKSDEYSDSLSHNQPCDTAIIEDNSHVAVEI